MPPPDRFRVTLLLRAVVEREIHLGTLAAVRHQVRIWRADSSYTRRHDIWIVDEKTGTEYSVDPHGQLTEM